MNDANKQHQQELYNEKLTNKKNEVEKHAKETISSRNKNKKAKENHSNANVISRIENVNRNDFDMEYNFGKIKWCV